MDIMAIHIHAHVVHPPYIRAFHQNAPISIRLMGGEYLVIKSIIEFSIPYLIGWAPAMEASLQANIDKAADESGGLGGDGFHDNYNRNSRSTNYHTRDSVLRGNNNDVPF
mmetsp:Transcript_4938/g.13054  ORF Transcript_4938/g.13054 Transcript_4938/m.13054 type:complete len:110 (-) Transcript_4938:204-533(-)